VASEPTLRWTAASATGVVLAHPATLYSLRLAVSLANNQTVVAVLYDDPAAATNAVLAMTALNGQPDDWPKSPMRIKLEHGLYVAFTGTGSAILTVGWNAM